MAYHRSPPEREAVALKGPNMVGCNGGCCCDDGLSTGLDP